MRRYFILVTLMLLILTGCGKKEIVATEPVNSYNSADAFANGIINAAEKYAGFYSSVLSADEEDMQQALRHTIKTIIAIGFMFIGGFSLGSGLYLLATNSDKSGCIILSAIGLVVFLIGMVMI